MLVTLSMLVALSKAVALSMLVTLVEPPYHIGVFLSATPGITRM